MTLRPMQTVVLKVTYTNGSGVTQTVRNVTLNAAVHGGAISPSLPIALGQIEVELLNPPVVANGGTAVFITQITPLSAPQTDSPNQAGYAATPPAALSYDIGASIICSAENVSATTDEVTVNSFPSTIITSTAPSSASQTQWQAG